MPVAPSARLSRNIVCYGTYHMSPLVSQLSKYATYHRDWRNIKTHFIGIPMIVLSVFVLLSKPAFSVFGLMLTPAMLVFLLSSLYYLRLSSVYGVAMVLVHGLLLTLADNLALNPMWLWLLWGVGLFVLGWVIQFVGHYYEGRKPAFVDDLMGLAIGPLFVVAEAGFVMGLGRKVQNQIEAVAGPIRHPVA